MTVEVALSVMAGARVRHLLVCDEDGRRVGQVSRSGLIAVRDGSGYTDRVRLRDISPLGDVSAVRDVGAVRDVSAVCDISTARGISGDGTPSPATGDEHGGSPGVPALAHSR
ncbi:CBS domain-containing protein [Streptomyces sp. G44]|uniref:CBS domain-containing protein n=1 Tax=Streptomyces sp. G44 TaxID=2807632 RepID=UPI001961D984|nr:CBS domain-containing protein [Streptomyces sp. G44]